MHEFGHVVSHWRSRGSLNLWVCSIPRGNARAADGGRMLTVTTIAGGLQENDDTATETNMSIYVKKRAHECTFLGTLPLIGVVEVA